MKKKEEVDLHLRVKSLKITSASLPFLLFMLIITFLILYLENLLSFFLFVINIIIIFIILFIHITIKKIIFERCYRIPESYIRIKKELKIKVIEKKIIKKLRKKSNGVIIKIITSPYVSVVVRNPTSYDIEDIELKWYLYDTNTETLIADNLNRTRKKFSLASTGKYIYNSPIKKASILKNKEYKLKIKAYSRGKKIGIIDNIKVIQFKDDTTSKQNELKNISSQLQNF